METSTHVPPISGNHFLTVCNYITTLGIIFNNNNLLSSAVVSETVSVFNALFEYLNESDNKTATRIHLFQEIQSKTNISTFEELNNFDDANDFYHYIINVALFAPYGNIANYVKNIVRSNSDKSFLDLHKLLFHEFSNNFIIINVCSLRKKSGNINFHAVERIFAEYLSPALTEMWEVEKNLKNLQMNDLKVLKRFKRQSPPEENYNDLVAINEEDLPINEVESVKLFRMEFLSKLKPETFSAVLKQERERFCKIIKSLAIEQLNGDYTYASDLYLVDSLERSRLGNFLLNLEGSTFSLNSYWLASRKILSKLLSNIWKTYPQSDVVPILYHIPITDSFYGIVDISQYSLNNMYVLYPKMRFTITSIKMEEREGKTIYIIDLELDPLSFDAWYNLIHGTKCKQLFNKRNSKRMYAIEKTADFISSYIPTSTFTEVANTLKSYILPVHPVISGIPTYYAVSQHTTNYTMFLEKYSVMKITNNKHTDDVLYDSKFYFPHDFDQSQKHLKKVYSYIRQTLQEYYNMYRSDLDSLQKKLRFEDFFQITYKLKKTNVERLPKDLRIALLRVALRQCDEELNEEPIVLYQTLVVTSGNQHRYSLIYVTLNIKDAYSENHDLVRRRMFHLLSRNENGIIYFLKIHLKNRCGLADVREFIRDEIKSYFLPISQKYKRIEKFKETIGDKEVVHLTLKLEDVPKEKIMLNMVKLLNSLCIEN